MSFRKGITVSLCEVTIENAPTRSTLWSFYSIMPQWAGLSLLHECVSALRATCASPNLAGRHPMCSSTIQICFAYRSFLQLSTYDPVHRSRAKRHIQIIHNQVG